MPPLVPLFIFCATVAPTARPVAQATSDEALARAVWSNAPAVADARRALAAATGDATQAQLLPNPALAATWGTIPIGHRNGENLSFWDVPSYAVNVSQTFELGKRKPRQAAFASFARAQQQQVLEAFRTTFFSVLATMVEQAAAAVSAREFDQLVADSASSLALQQARADKGDTAGLDVDRLSVEHERLISARDEHLAAQEAALRACASLLGGPCPRFSSADEAAAYLDRGLTIDVATTPGWQDRRPDLQALRAQAEGENSLEVLGRRRSIPDPTVTFGYMKDRFVYSGNQANSLMLSVSVPLPVFDRGQVASHTAAMQRQATLDTTAALIRSGAAELTHAEAQLALSRHRADHLQNQVLPRAQNVLERLQAAAARGGVPLQEVLLARRTLEDLRLERVDVVAHANHLWVEIRMLNADMAPLAAATP